MEDTYEDDSEPTDSSEETADVASPHDALFYKTFSKPEHAAAEMKCIFPPGLVARIDWDTLEPLPLKFVDAKLSSRYADVLYSVEMNGNETLIYFLFEHKAHNDSWTLLQMLEYKTRIWRAYIEDPKNHGKARLPVILAAVLHHSERGWTSPLRFRDYFDVAPKDVQWLDPYMLDFGIVLDDISKMGGEAIATRPMTPEGRLVLFALRFGRTPRAVIDELPSIVPLLLTVHAKPHGDLVIAAIIVYLKTVGKLPEAEVRVALQRVVGNSIAEEILFGAERRLAKAVREGELRERRGELNGRRITVKRLLAQRFGALPPDAIALIDNASASDLDAMDLRVLTAATLNEALGMSGQS